MNKSDALELLRNAESGIARWNRLRADDERLPSLSGADLSRADLRRADLRHARLMGSTLTNADLTAADLSGADLSRAGLGRANLSIGQIVGAKLGNSNLILADFFGANLSGTDLSNADLSGANLRGANLVTTDFSGARIGNTVFANVDLSSTRGLETVEHTGPSTIGVDTLYRSNGNIPPEFLRGCGLPENLIAYLPSLTGKAFDYYTCFISYTESDDEFSKRLYNDLKGEGVRCWRWREDAPWGKTMMRSVDEAVRTYEKLIVILSKDSLKSEPVIREIERALQKEQREAKEVLFPIRLDSAIFSWEHELQADVVRKHVGDFTDWKSGKQYSDSFKRLVRDLQAQPSNS